MYVCRHCCKVTKTNSARLQILGMHEFMHHQIQAMNAELSQRFASARVHALLTGDTAQADKLKAGEFMTIETSDADAIKQSVLSQYTPAPALRTPPQAAPTAPPPASFGRRAGQQLLSAAATDRDTVPPSPGQGRRAGQHSATSAPEKAPSPPLCNPAGVHGAHDMPAATPVAERTPLNTASTAEIQRSLRSSSPGSKSTVSTSTRGGRKRPKGGAKRKGVVATRYVHKTASAWGDGEYVTTAPRRGARPKRNWGPGAAKPKASKAPASKAPAKAMPRTKDNTAPTTQRPSKAGNSAEGMTTKRNTTQSHSATAVVAAAAPPQTEQAVSPEGGVTEPKHTHLVETQPELARADPGLVSVLQVGREAPPTGGSPIHVRGGKRGGAIAVDLPIAKSNRSPPPHVPTPLAQLLPKGVQGGSPATASPSRVGAAAGSPSSPSSPGDECRIGARLPPAPPGEGHVLNADSGAGFTTVAAAATPPSSPEAVDGGARLPRVHPSRPHKAAHPSDAVVIPLSTKAYSAHSSAPRPDQLEGVFRGGYSPRAVAAEALQSADARSAPQDMSYSQQERQEAPVVSADGSAAQLEGQPEHQPEQVDEARSSSSSSGSSDGGGSEAAAADSSDEETLDNPLPLVGDAHNTVAKAFPMASTGSSGDAGSALGGLAGNAARSRKAESAGGAAVSNGLSLRHILGACIDGLAAATPVLRQYLQEAAAAAVTKRFSPNIAAAPAVTPSAEEAPASSDDSDASDEGGAGGVQRGSNYPIGSTDEASGEAEESMFQVEPDEDDLMYFVAARYYLTSGRKVGLLLRRTLQGVDADQWLRLPRGAAAAAYEAKLPVLRGGQVVPHGSVPPPSHADSPRWVRIVWLPLPRERLAPAAAQSKAAQAVSANAVLAAACSVWLYWGGRRHAPPHTVLTAWQRTNHFQRHGELTRKDSLQRNLRRYAVLGGKMAAAFHVMPETFVLPGQYMAFAEAYGRDILKTHHSQRQQQFRDGLVKGGAGVKSARGTNGGEASSSMWIVKPLNSSCGRGIRVISELEEVNFSEAAVLQRYLHTPMLLDGYKFDLRVYVLVTSFAPLEAYVYSNGLARFSSKPYTTSAAGHADKLVHLTNSSIQKHTGAVLSFLSNTTTQEAAGTKCSLAFLWRLICARGGDAAALWREVKLCALKSLVCVDDVIRAQPSCFELYGFDVMLDSAGKGWLIEVNASPSLACGTPLDTQLKTAVMRDTLRLVSPAPVLPGLMQQALQAASSTGHTPATWSASLSNATLHTRVRPYGAASADVAQHIAKLTRGGTVLPFSVPTSEEAASGFELLCPNTPEHAAITELKYSVFTSSLSKAGH